MIKLENFEVVGWEHAIRGMRNPMNSWDKSDSHTERSEVVDADIFLMGDNDLALADKLANAGPVHGKFRRMIGVYVDITAPLYWWKEFDTYKVGTVANSCSTMHKIHAKEFKLSDFSCEHLSDNVIASTVNVLETYRRKYIETQDKEYWWKIIQLLPSSYNQKRTVYLNYEVLSNIYEYRRNHKLDEWRTFCNWIEELPYSSELILCGNGPKEEV